MRGKSQKCQKDVWPLVSREKIVSLYDTFCPSIERQRVTGRRRSAGRRRRRRSSSPSSALLAWRATVVWGSNDIRSKSLSNDLTIALPLLTRLRQAVSLV